MMLRRFSIAVALLCAIGCPRAENVTATDTISTSGTETTGTTSKTSTGSSGGTVSSLNAEEKRFFITAVQANLSEIRAAQLALTKATSNDVRNLANRIVADHFTANQQLKQLAITKGVALPAVTTKEPNRTADELADKVGKDFDRAFIEAMIRDHEKAIGEFQKESQQAHDPDLKTWVIATLPTLQVHLDTAKQVDSKLK